MQTEWLRPKNKMADYLGGIHWEKPATQYGIGLGSCEPSAHAMTQDRSWDMVTYALIDLCNVPHWYLPPCDEMVHLAHMAQHELCPDVGQSVALGVIPSKADLG